MAIFSAARRQSALLDDGMLAPNGKIDLRDRMNLLGQYAGALPAEATGNSSGLSFRQQRLFDGLCDLWQPSFPVGASGGEATTYSLVQSDVPYVLDRKSSIERPWEVGAIETEDMITTDTMRFPPGTSLGSQWIVVERSVTITGALGANYGEGWACKGDPISDDDLDLVRRAGCVEAYTTHLARLPAVIAAYYA